MKKKTKVIIIILSIVLAVTIGVSSFFIGFEKGRVEGKSFSFGSSGGGYDLNDLSTVAWMSDDERKKKEDEINAVGDLIDKLIDEKKYTDISDEFAALTKEVNEKICDFFLKRYDLDVSEKMSKVEAKIYDPSALKSGDISLGGFYSEREDARYLVFISDWVGEDFDSFSELYVHECMHYLGVCLRKDDVVGAQIYESMAELLTARLCLSEGISYTHICGYKPELIDGIIDDDELVKKVISGDGRFDIAEEVNRVFGNDDFCKTFDDAYYLENTAAIEFLGLAYENAKENAKS